MRLRSSRAKVSPCGVLLQETRESTCKSGLIDRIFRRTTHTLHYYHFPRAKTLGGDNSGNVEKSIVAIGRRVAHLTHLLSTSKPRSQGILLDAHN